MVLHRRVLDECTKMTDYNGFKNLYNGFVKSVGHDKKLFKESRRGQVIRVCTGYDVNTYSGFRW